MNENRKPEIDDMDDVARLVRLAGRRQPVPLERSERVRGAAREQWRHEVRTRTRRRRFGWAVAGLGAAASLLLVLATGVLPERNASAVGSSMRVETIAGDLLATPVLTAAGDLAPGTVLTTSAAGRAAIRLASGHSLRLDAATAVRVLDGRALALERGALYIDSGFDGPVDGAVDIHTPSGVIEEIGTQFEVRLEGDSLRVRLREGAVIVHREAGNLRLGEGTELVLAADGTAVRRSIAVHGPAWDWTAAVAPMPDLEGRTARSFLDWIARENGWKLAFADEAVARAADEIVLGGTVESLTLGEALDAVLPTCRMTHRVEGGVLVVAAIPEV